MLLLGTLALAAFAIAAASLYSFAALTRVYQEDALEQAIDLAEVERLRALAEQKVGRTRAYLFTGDDRFLSEAEASRQALIQQGRLLEPMLRTREARELLAEALRLEAAHHRAIEAALQARAEEGGRERAEALWERDARPARAALDESLASLYRFKRAQLDRAQETVDRTQVRVFWSLGLVIVLALAVGILMAFTVARRLVALYDESQRAIAARDTFLSIASHELRTPLTALKLQLDSLARARRPAALPPEVGGKLEAARRHVKRLTGLVEDLLDSSRIHLGRLPLILGACDLTQLVRQVVSAMELEFEAAGTQVAVATRGDTAGFWDGDRLEQVVTNLLTNAAKFGRHHPVEVAIEGEETHVSLQVTDHGIGIAPEDSERIFRPFERAVSERHYGGLGIGLFISRSIVEAHGGLLRVSSEPGDGTTFVVQLPRQPPTGDQATGG